MKICIVSYDNNKQNNTLVEYFQSKGFDVQHIDFFSFRYRYPNFLYRIYNAFLKVFRHKSIKKIYYGKEIIKKLSTMEKQDLIITLKGDFVDPDYLKQMKNFTNRSVAFFNDPVSHYPRIKDVYQCFDETFSFEKKDCEKYGMTFLTNWIFTSELNQSDGKYWVYNISSMDHRFPILDKVGKALKERNIPYKIQVLKSKKNYKSDNIEIINKRLSLDDINEYVKDSKALLEIQKSKQEGLSFRVFECMGYKKKLLTTNPDVVNYDFYNPNNIMVINEKNFETIGDFLSTPYEDISKELYDKYTIDGWLHRILK